MRRSSWALGLFVAACFACSPSAVSPPAAAKARARLAPEAALDDVRTLHLSYQAPAECPATEGYIGHVQSRSARLRFEPDVGVEAPSASDRVDVTVVPDAGGAGWLGQLSISGSTSLRREVVGARCQDVVAALALITVLRFEGDEAAASRNNGAARPGAAGAASSPGGAADRATPASAAPAAGAPPPSMTPATAAAPPPTGRADAATTSPRRVAPAEQGDRTTAGAPALVEPAPALVEPAPALVEPAPALVEPAPAAGERSRAAQPDSLRAPEPPPEATEARSPLSEESRRSEPAGEGTTRSSAPWRWPVIEPRVFGSLGYASVPSHAFKAALGAELRFGEGAAGWVGALSLAYARGDHANAYGRLALTLLTLELQLCPQRVAPYGSFWLRACGQLRGGGINLSISPGERPVVPEDAQWRPWAAVGPGLAAGFPLTPRWELRGLFELAFQLVRDRFEVARLGSEGTAEGGAVDTLYRPAPLSLELALGLSVAF